MKKQDIINKIFSNTEETFIDMLNSKTAFLKKDLNDFESFHKKIFEETDLSKNDPELNSILRKKLIDFINSLISWLKLERSYPESLFEKKPWHEWLNRNFTAERGLPEKVEFPYPERIPKQGKKHSLSNFIYKRPVYFIKSSRFRKRSRLEMEKNHGREINLSDYIQFNYAVPLSEFLLNQWQKLLHTAVEIIYQAQIRTERLKDEMLISAEFDSGQDYWQLLKENDSRESIFTYKHINAELNFIIGNYEKKYAIELSEFLNDLKVQFASNLDIAGSPLLTNRSFHNRKSQKKIKKMERRFEKIKSKWQRQYDGSEDEWLKNLELSFIQFSAAEMYYEISNIISQKINNKLVVLFDDIKNIVTDTYKKFEKPGIKPDILQNLLLNENKNLVKSLRQQNLPTLMDTIIRANIDQIFRGYFNRIEIMLDLLSEKHIIFSERDIYNTPPDSKFAEIPLKELVLEEIITSSFNRIKELENMNEDINMAISRGISNLDQIVEFNLTAALSLLRERQDEETINETRQIALEGLERTQTLLRELKTSFIQGIQNETSLFSTIAREFENDIQKLGDNEEILQLKLRLARAKSKNKIITAQKRIWKKFLKMLPLIIESFKGFFKKIQSEIQKFREATGLGPQIKLSGKAVIRFLITTSKKIDKMPYLYKRLFSLEPLSEKRFLYARDEQIFQLREDFENFKNGYQGATAIIGEKGNGKSTLLNFAGNYIFAGYKQIKINCKTTIHSETDLIELINTGFNLQHLKTFDELEYELKNKSEKQICILENIHNLFLRVIDGFESLERLLLFMLNTRYNIFWIVSSGIYAWEYLDKLLRISENFMRVISLDNLNENELQEIILRRHKVSGYGIHFKDSENAGRSRHYKKLNTYEEQQNYLKTNFFENLQEISGGNIKSALMFWLSAIENFDESKIEISAEIILDRSSVLQLSADELFMLHALIQHDFLNEQQLAEVLNQSPDEIRLMTGRLYRKGYLVRVNNDYTINSFLYRPVVKALKAKKFLI